MAKKIPERLLAATFVLANGTFVDSGKNTVRLTGLRMSSKITRAGGPSKSQLSLRVYGMSLSMMNQLSTLGMLVTMVQRNSVTLEAGTDDGGMAICFQGTITAAWAALNDMPDVSFHIEATTGLDVAVSPTAPISFKGDADVATIMSGIATQMGLAFENNGVNAKLSNPYFSGQLYDQAKYCADHAGIGFIIEHSTLVIWPKNSTRGGAIPLINKDSGLVGYPEYTAQGIKLSSLYNPSIGFMRKIKLESTMFDPNLPQSKIALPSDGIWVVFDLEDNLDCLMPNGNWFTRLQAYNPTFQPQAPVAQ